MTTVLWLDQSDFALGCSLLSDLAHPLGCSIAVLEAWTASCGLLSLSPLLPHKVSLYLCFSSSHKYKHVRVDSGLVLGSLLYSVWPLSSQAAVGDRPELGRRVLGI